MRRTITDEVGTGPISILTIDDDANELDSSEARMALPTGDWRSGNIDLNLGGADAPLESAPVVATDDGPTPGYVEAAKRATAPKAANDNAKRYHLKEMYERGELGNGQPENEQHWIDAERLRLDLMMASGEPVNDVIDWREIMLQFFEGFFNDIMTSFSPDEGLSFNDDGEFDDTDTTSEGNVVDNGDWNFHRDLPPKIEQLYAEQVKSLAHDELGQDFELLQSFIESNWTTLMAGEKEGYTGATARACGKGMLRSALRNLTRFYQRLDYIEERGKRPHDVWPLIGTLNWKPKRHPHGVRRPSDLAFMGQARGAVRKWQPLADLGRYTQRYERVKLPFRSAA